MKRSCLSPPSDTAVHLLGLLIATLLRLLGATWRLETRGLEPLSKLLADDRRVLLVFWHGGYLPLFPLLRGHKAAILTSDSLRGRIIMEICRRFGYQGMILPGNNHTSAQALRQIAVTAGKAIALAADGPLGPARRVKSGAVRLASDLAFVIIPAATVGRHQWTAWRRWDHMSLPVPFTRVALIFGEPIHVPTGLGGPGIRDWETRISSALEAAHRTAAQQVGRAAHTMAEPPPLLTPMADEERNNVSRPPHFTAHALQSWFIGLALIAGIIAVGTHLSELEAFLELAQNARPRWLLIAIFVLDAATLWVLLHAIGLEVSFWVALPSFVMASIAATLGLVPLGLGTFEATCLVMLNLLGVPLEAALTATILLRGLTLWLPMLPGLWFVRRALA